MQIDGVPLPNTPLVTERALAPTQSVTQEFGQDAFLKLLLAELQNQDPLKPMEDKDFIAQLAQFEQLSQITAMNKTLTEVLTTQPVNQGSALLGQIVSGYSEEGQAVTGLVSGFYITNDSIILEVDSHRVPLNAVQSVQAPSTQEEPPAEEDIPATAEPKE